MSPIAIGSGCPCCSMACDQPPPSMYSLPPTLCAASHRIMVTPTSVGGSGDKHRLVGLVTPVVERRLLNAYAEDENGFMSLPCARNGLHEHGRVKDLANPTLTVVPLI